MLSFIDIIPVPLIESLGTITGKYPAKDKITSSAVDLMGEESIQRLLHISDSNNPYRFDLRRGALARVAGGGIHFSDEIFKNKKDLVQVYLGVIQNRVIEIDGYKWPIDTLIVATSNNSEFHKFLSEKEEAPIIDRCRICYVSHNTNYKLQKDLTAYAIGSETRTTLTREYLHQDPNLNYAASVAPVLTRLPRSEKLTPVIARFIFALMGLSCIVVLLIGKFFIELVFGVDFLPAYPSLILLLPGMIALGLYGIIKIDLFGRKMPGTVSLLTGIAVAVNLALNYFTIPRWGIRGAAISSSFSYLLCLSSRLQAQS